MVAEGQTPHEVRLQGAFRMNKDSLPDAKPFEGRGAPCDLHPWYLTAEPHFELDSRSLHP